MNYILTVLTNGRPGYLARTLAAFQEHVSPQPDVVYIYDDGSRTPLDAFAAYADADVAGESRLIGMCAAHARCWGAARDSYLDWAFHIEDDYRILCPVDLAEIRDVLVETPHLAQMTLMRTPWGAEVEHGGYVAQTPGWYERHPRWFETTRNWAAAPTLFRTELARKLDWPIEPGCETAIGPRIIAVKPEARFGIWGRGECQVAHLGVQRAQGSHGY